MMCSANSFSQHKLYSIKMLHSPEGPVNKPVITPIDGFFRDRSGVSFLSEPVANNLVCLHVMAEYQAFLCAMKNLIYTSCVIVESG